MKIRTLILLLFLILNAFHFKLFARIHICTSDEDTLKINHYFSMIDYYAKNDKKNIGVYLDSLKNSIKETRNPEYLARYYNIGIAHFLNLNQFDSALKYSMKALPYITKIQNQKTKINIYSNYGLYLIKKDSNSKAILYFRKSIELAKKTNKTTLLAKNYLDLGNIFKKKNIFDSAYYFNSLCDSLYRMVKDTTGIILSMNSKAVLLSKMGFNTKSISTYYQLLAIDSVFEGYNLIPTILLNMGDIYSRNLKNEDSAIYFLNKCLEYATENNDEFLIEATKVNISNVYFNKKNYAEIIKILIGNRNSNFNIIQVASIINTGIAFKELHDDSAYYFLNKGVELAEKFEMLDFENNGLKHLYIYDSLKGDYKSAFIHFQKYHLLLDSLTSLSNISTIHELKTLHEEEKLNQQKEYWKIQNQLSKERLSKKSKQTNILFFLSLFLIVFIILITGISSLLNKSRKKLSENLTELEKVNKELNSVNNMKNMMFSILTHDLKSNILPSNQLINLLSENYWGYSDEEKHEIIRSISKTSDSVKLLMNNLLEWIRVQHTKAEYEFQKINLYNLVNDLINNQINSLNVNSIEIKNTIKDIFTFKSNENIIQAILRNLISNSLKFTPKNGLIIISAKLENNLVCISVSDNGIGMSKEIMAKIFDTTSSYTRLGLNKEKGSGFGLKLVNQLVKEINGSISVESKEGEGTIFTVIIPQISNNS